MITLIWNSLKQLQSCLEQAGGDRRVVAGQGGGAQLSKDAGEEERGGEDQTHQAHAQNVASTTSKHFCAKMLC